MAVEITNLSGIIDDFIQTCVENTDEKNDISLASERLSIYYKKEFSNKGLMTKFINFGEEQMKLAYVIRYSNMHAHSTCHYLKKCLSENLKFKNMIKKIRTAAPFNIVSLGAGPASDVLGIIEALHTTVGVNSFHCRLLDKYTEWSEYAQRLFVKATQFKPNLSISLKYKRCDFSKELDLFIENANVNLLCISKFLSEVLKAFGKTGENNLKIILNALPKNAIVFFMDNQREYLELKMEKLAKECNLERIYMNCSTYSLPENALDPVKKYRAIIGGKSKSNRNQKLSVIIYRRVCGSSSKLRRTQSQFTSGAVNFSSISNLYILWCLFLLIIILVIYRQAFQKTIAVYKWCSHPFSMRNFYNLWCLFLVILILVICRQTAEKTITVYKWYSYLFSISNCYILWCIFMIFW